MKKQKNKKKSNKARTAELDSSAKFMEESPTAKFMEESSKEVEALGGLALTPQTPYGTGARRS